MEASLDYSSVAGRVARVREDIHRAAQRSGRRPEDIELMAVTKFHPIEAVEAVYAAGLRLFGENRVQEAAEKFPAFLAERKDARLELIGHLQSNKARKAAALFSRVQSVHSLELIDELAKRRAALIGAGEAEGPLEILLELHTGEESKSGFPDLEALLRAVDRLEEAAPGPAGKPVLALRGLMTMAPYTSEEAPIRASFRALRAAFETIGGRLGDPAFSVLSMGMTNDYPIAVEEGSTLLRIGTAFFGERTHL